MAGTGILAMLAKPKSKGGSVSGPPEPETEMEDDGVAGALRDMFDHLKAGRDGDAAKAFKAAYESCAGGGAPEPDADDAEEDDGLDL